MPEPHVITEKRKVFRWEDSTWVETQFSQLVRGDLYRLFEENGTWAGQWEACSNAYFQDGVWCCQSVPR